MDPTPYQPRPYRQAANRPSAYRSPYLEPEDLEPLRYGGEQYFLPEGRPEAFGAEEEPYLPAGFDPSDPLGLDQAVKDARRVRAALEAMTPAPSTTPIVFEPLLADPLLADPLLADPLLADPLLADPLLAKPPVPVPAAVPGPEPAGEPLAAADPDVTTTLPVTTRRSRVRATATDAPAVVEPAAHGRAGRNLPAAIGIGLLLAALALGSLFTRPEAFIALTSIVVVLAVWELSGVMTAKQVVVPVVPLAVGSLGMLVSAYVAGEEGLLVSFALTGLGVVLWRIIDGVDGAVRDITAGLFTAAYVPLLAGFALLLLADPDGPKRVLTFILVTVASDNGGYIAGVLFGKHLMAPTISPKKSWEGFAGSVVLCLAIGVASVVFLLHGQWWVGLALGAAAPISATLGDLAESMLKRDLGVKDMGSLLPGHGGIMDRLDSLLPTAPVAYLLLHFLASR